MIRQTAKRSGPTLSIDDQKALDVLLNQGAAAASDKTAKHAPSVAPGRLMAVSKVLDLLAQMPEVHPPANLVARTMDLIDRDRAGQVATRAESVHKSSQPEVH